MLQAEQTDHELLYALQQNNSSAFNELFNRYWNQSFCYAKNRLKSTDLAKDVVQELFISLWIRRQSLSITGSFAGYLHTALRYEVLHRLSKAIREGVSDIDIEKDILPDFTNHLDAMQQEELLAIVEKEVNKLPEKMQQVYRLSREEDLSIREIASRLQLSEQTVRNQLNLAIQRLRANLREALIAAILLQQFLKTGNDLVTFIPG